MAPELGPLTWSNAVSENVFANASSRTHVVNRRMSAVLPSDQRHEWSPLGCVVPASGWSRSPFSSESAPASGRSASAG